MRPIALWTSLAIAGVLAVLGASIAVAGAGSVLGWIGQNWLGLGGALAGIATAIFLFPSFIESVRRPAPRVEVYQLDNAHTVVACISSSGDAPLRPFDSVYLSVGPWPIEIRREARFEDGLTYEQLRDKYASPVPPMVKELQTKSVGPLSARAKLDRGLYFAWDDEAWSEARISSIVVRVRMYYGEREVLRRIRFTRRKRPHTLVLTRVVELMPGIPAMQEVAAKRIGVQDGHD